MKMKMFVALVLTVAGSAFAADDVRPLTVELSAKKVDIASDRAILIRTSETPRSIKVHMSIPYGRTYCAEYGTEMQYGPDYSCGYDRQCHWECYNGCNVWQNGHCQNWGDHCGTRCYDYMRSCLHPETVCVRHDVATHNESKSFKLVFSNATDLNPGETETFEIKGFQDGVDRGNDKYELKVIEAKKAYTVKQFNFFGDWIKVKGN